MMLCEIRGITLKDSCQNASPQSNQGSEVNFQSPGRHRGQRNKPNNTKRNPDSVNSNVPASLSGFNKYILVMSDTNNRGLGGRVGG